MGLTYKRRPGGGRTALIPIGSSSSTKAGRKPTDRRRAGAASGNAAAPCGRWASTTMIGSIPSGWNHHLQTILERRIPRSFVPMWARTVRRCKGDIVIRTTSGLTKAATLALIAAVGAEVLFLPAFRRSSIQLKTGRRTEIASLAGGEVTPLEKVTRKCGGLVFCGYSFI